MSTIEASLAWRTRQYNISMDLNEWRKTKATGGTLVYEKNNGFEKEMIYVGRLPLQEMIAMEENLRRKGENIFIGEDAMVWVKNKIHSIYLATEAVAKWPEIFKGSKNMLYSYNSCAETHIQLIHLENI